MSKSKKVTSTFDREMKNAKFKKAFDKSYEEFSLSEALLEMMEENKKKSIRKLAKATHLSPTTIQNLRSKKNGDIKMQNFIGISREYGYHLILEKGGKRILLG
jgi:hypothetical protein